MQLAVREADLHLGDCSTRLPFRFGISTLTFAPMCTARVLVEGRDGLAARGFSAELLVPKWFEKIPDQPPQTDVDRLLDSARGAAEQLVSSQETRSVFDHWLDLYDARVAAAPADAPDRLVRGFGVALLERALIDAACRAAGASFFEAVHSDLLGFEPARVHPVLAGWTPARLGSPLATVRVRHTVGLLDALRSADIAPADRLDDQLPESLEEDIAHYGLTHFKIKVCGDREADVDRLLRIGDVITERVVHPRITLDGNEQYADMGELAALLEELNSTDRGARLLDQLMHIEQPIGRHGSFDAQATAAMAAVTAFAPVIIDEADDRLDALERAAACGYGGISVKNCKGVFRALLNRAQCDASRGTLFQSAEDLTNLPILPLQQDLATVALLGLEHVERNGHHYFPGLDHLPATEVEQALADHPDLYERTNGGARLRIENGMIALGSLGCPGYAHRGFVDLTARTPADDWRWPA